MEHACSECHASISASSIGQTRKICTYLEDLLYFDSLYVFSEVGFEIAVVYVRHLDRCLFGHSE